MSIRNMNTMNFGRLFTYAKGKRNKKETGKQGECPVACGFKAHAKVANNNISPSPHKEC